MGYETMKATSKGWCKRPMKSRSKKSRQSECAGGINFKMPPIKCAPKHLCNAFWSVASFSFRPASSQRQQNDPQPNNFEERASLPSLDRIMTLNRTFWLMQIWCSLSTVPSCQLASRPLGHHCRMVGLAICFVLA